VRRNAIDLKLYGQLIRVRVLADLAGQATKVTAAGWDAEKGERTAATSEGLNLGPGSGRTGAQIFEEALGERSEHIGHLAATTSAEATELANAAFDQRARAFVRLEATAEGNPALRIGTHVNISGVSARFDNTYYVTRACHRFNLREGYRTLFNAECAYLGEAG
jgi:phage protein D